MAWAQRVATALALVTVPLTLSSGQGIEQPNPLQRAVTRSMAGRQGAVVVLDVESGSLLAVHDRDMAGRRLAPPGSAIKPFTLLGLLDTPGWDPAEPFVCPTRLRLGGYRMDCTHVITDAPLDAATALAYSCNNYFAHHARRLQASSFLQALRRMGFDARTGLVDREVAGTLEPAEDETAKQLQALGQEGIAVTPLELASAYRALALMRREPDADERYRFVFDGLEGATEYGTARLAQPAGLRVAGKTGTSSARAGRWTHGWFAGYAPAADPEIVVVVFIEKGQGGADAAPIAGEIFAAFRSLRRSE